MLISTFIVILKYTSVGGKGLLLTRLAAKSPVEATEKQIRIPTMLINYRGHSDFRSCVTIVKNLINHFGVVYRVTW